jgi:hypothetical protein
MPVDDTSIVIGRGVILVEADSLAVIAECLVEFALTMIDGSAVVVSNGIIWFDTNSITVIADSLVEVSLVTIGIPATEIRSRKILSSRIASVNSMAALI